MRSGPIVQQVVSGNAINTPSESAIRLHSTARCSGLTLHFFLQVHVSGERSSMASTVAPPTPQQCQWLCRRVACRSSRSGRSSESSRVQRGTAGPGITVLPISTAWWTIGNGFTIGAGEIHTVVRLDLVLTFLSPTTTDGRRFDRFITDVHWW